MNIRRLIPNVVDDYRALMREAYVLHPATDAGLDMASAAGLAEFLRNRGPAPDSQTGSDEIPRERY